MGTRRRVSCAGKQGLKRQKIKNERAAEAKTAPEVWKQQVQVDTPTAVCKKRKQTPMTPNNGKLASAKRVKSIGATVGKATMSYGDGSSALILPQSPAHHRMDSA